MEFDKKRIEDLRKRLKDCYKIVHKDDNKRLGHLMSTKTSELNPFLIALSSDLKERFGDESSGNSPHTLRSIFFSDKLTYDGDTISNLELFCSEIEKDNSDSGILDLEIGEITSILNLKEGNFFMRYRTIITYLISVLALPLVFLITFFLANEDNALFFGMLLLIVWLISTIISVKGILTTLNRVRKIKIKRFRLTIFSLGLIVSVTYIFYAYVGSKYIIEELNGTSRKPTNLEAFVKDPASLGYGTTSINFGIEGANDLDILDVNFLKGNDSLVFYVFIDYQNATNLVLDKARAKINFTNQGVSKSTNINGQLMSSKGRAVIDETRIVNLPNRWKIKILEAYCMNTHSEEQCPNYAYEIKLDTKELIGNDGVMLPILDTYGKSSLNGYTGACSQGHVVVKFQVNKT